MSKLNVQLCPETGICSIVKEDGSKVDLMPGEVLGVREAAGKAAEIQKAIAEVDSGFAKDLNADELAQIARRLK